MIQLEMSLHVINSINDLKEENCMIVSTHSQNHLTNKHTFMMKVLESRIGQNIPQHNKGYA